MAQNSYKFTYISNEVKLMIHLDMKNTKFGVFSQIVGITNSERKFLVEEVSGSSIRNING